MGGAPVQECSTTVASVNYEERDAFAGTRQREERNKKRPAETVDTLIHARIANDATLNEDKQTQISPCDDPLCPALLSTFGHPLFNARIYKFTDTRYTTSID